MRYTKFTKLCFALLILLTANAGFSQERIYANGHRIEITLITNSDLNSFSGIGEARFTSDATLWTTISFSNLKINNTGSFFVIESGTIPVTPDTVYTVDVQPGTTGASDAKLDIKSYELSSEGLKIIGDLRFVPPFGSSTALEFPDNKFFYNEIYPVGAVEILQDIDLTVEQGVDIRLDKDASSFLLNGNNSNDIFLIANYDGTINISNISVIENLSLPFFSPASIDFFTAETQSTLNFTGSIDLSLMSNKYTFDQSVEQSLEGTDINAKGIFFEDYSFSLPVNPASGISFQSGLEWVGTSAVSLQNGTLSLSEEASINKSGTLYDLNADFTSIELNTNENLNMTLEGTVDLFLLGSTSLVYSTDNTGSSTAKITSNNELVDLTFPIIKDTSNITYTGFQVDWLDTASASYTVQISKDKFTTLEEYQTTDRSFTTENLEPSTSYSFRVKARYPSGVETLSSDFELTTNTEPVLNVAGQPQIGIYPNPTNGTVRFSDLRKNQIINATLLDNSGKVLITVKEQKVADLEKILSEKLSSLNSGIYLFNIIENQHHHSFRIVVQ